MLNKVLITGANRGLGKCLVDEFRRVGDLVFPHNGRKDGDLCDIETVDYLASLARKEDINILINNAAIYMNNAFSKMTSTDFQVLLMTNLLAPINLTRAIWPLFKKKGNGLVIFINSVAGKCGSPGESAYCASKFGLKGFVDSLQFDGIRDKIRVLSIYRRNRNIILTHRINDTLFYSISKFLNFI